MRSYYVAEGAKAVSKEEAQRAFAEGGSVFQRVTFGRIGAAKTAVDVPKVFAVYIETKSGFATAQRLGVNPAKVYRTLDDRECRKLVDGETLAAADALRARCGRGVTR